MRPQLASTSYRSNLIACAVAEMGSMCTVPQLFASLLLISRFCFFLSRLSVRKAPDRSVTSPSVSASPPPGQKRQRRQRQWLEDQHPPASQGLHRVSSYFGFGRACKQNSIKCF